MSIISAKRRWDTISAIQSADWMINPLWALAHMELIGQLEKNDVAALASIDDVDLQDLQPQCFSLENFSFTSATDMKSAKAGSIMRMSVDGPMLRNGDMCSYGTEDYTAWLEEAKSNPNIEGVFIKANTPGGQSSGVPHLNQLVNDFPKPIVLWSNKGMIASAGVYSFIGADKVYASHRTDKIGSVGVYTRLRNVKEALAKMGVQDFEVYAPQSSEKNAEIRQLFEEGKSDLIEAELAFLADDFIQAVQASRGDVLKNVEGLDWKKGKLFNAEQALEIGLIDGILSEEDALKELVQLINNNKSTTEMFGDKHKGITALKGVEAVDVSEEALNDINANLDVMGVKGVRVINAAWIAEAESALGALGTATKERDEWKAKAEAFGSQPGAVPTIIPTSGGDDAQANKYFSKTDKELASLKSSLN